MKKLLVIVSVLFFSAISARYFGITYSNIYHLFSGFGSFIVPAFWSDTINGIFPAYIFFLTLLFTIFGGKNKYWWVGVGIIPALLFEMYFDWAHIYFPIIVGLIGWVIGWLILRAYQIATNLRK